MIQSSDLAVRNSSRIPPDGRAKGYSAIGFLSSESGVVTVNI